MLMYTICISACENTFLSSTQCHKKEGRKTAMVDVHRNLRLLGHKLFGFETRSRIDCVLMCLQIPACLSVNYLVENTYCEVNMGDAVALADLNEANGCDFMGRLSC